MVCLIAGGRLRNFLYWGLIVMKSPSRAFIFLHEGAVEDSHGKNTKIRLQASFWRWLDEAKLGSSSHTALRSPDGMEQHLVCIALADLFKQLQVLSLDVCAQLHGKRSPVFPTGQHNTKMESWGQTQRDSLPVQLWVCPCSQMLCFDCLSADFRLTKRTNLHRLTLGLMLVVGSTAFTSIAPQLSIENASVYITHNNSTSLIRLHLTQYLLHLFL